MDIKQFRMGNLVEYKGKPIPVVIIDSHQDIIVAADIYQSKLNSNLKTSDEDDLKPIPFTEEWAIIFNFIKVGIYYKLDFNGKQVCYYPEFSCLDIENLDGQTIVGNILYVHQFQNLYYDLSGEYLEIKEE